MAYRYSASGTLEVSDRNVETVCHILASKHIMYERQGNEVLIKHDERTSSTAGLKAEEAFEDLAPYIDKPQSLSVYSELLGEYEVGFIDGRVRTDQRLHVWCHLERSPTPAEVVTALRERGLACRVARVQGSRKSGRRSRVFEIQPGSGGPCCRVTVKRRFWDSYDLLSVPDVYQPLCRKYHMSATALRDSLHNAKFGLEVRNPALGNASSDLLFQHLLEVLEDMTDGIQTKLG